MRGVARRGAALCGVFAAVSIAGAARAADEAAVLQARAARLASEGRCAEALPIVREARTLAPGAADSALLEGKCLFQAGSYSEAVPPLTDAASLDPDSGEAALLLGMARYHAGDLAGASAALERAERQLPDRPEVPLYRGLLLLEGDPAAAAGRFESAAARGGALEPAATYYAGVARSGAGQREEADRLLRRVQELAPGSVWAQRADEALRTPAAVYRLRRWLALYLGIDYDSNVVLRGAGISLPADISNESDGLVWWGAEAGHELFRREGWGGGVLGNYYGNVHFDLNDFDQHNLYAGFWVDRTLGEDTLLRVQPEFGQSFYDYDGYLRFYGVLIELLRDWGGPGRGDFYARYDYNDYLYDIPGPPALQSTRDRDGHSVRAGYDHYYAIDQDTAVRGGPFFLYYAAQGDEYDAWGVGGWAGIERKLPWELTLDVLGSVAYVPYAHPSTFQVPPTNDDREDVISLVQVALSRPIFDHTTLTVRYRYQDNHSNTDVFDYDRHVVGAYVTVAFGD
jgi:tetratricopeptide (TPR) repeat protein